MIRRVLAVRGQFGRLLAASAVSQIGSGLHLAAFPILATSLTSDPRVIAALALVSAAPAIVLALPVGAWVDHSHRGRLMVGSDLVCAGTLAGLVALMVTGSLRLWVLFAAAVLLGVAELVFGTSSFALVPSVVPAAELERANGRLSVTAGIGRGTDRPDRRGQRLRGGTVPAVRDQGPVLPGLGGADRIVCVAPTVRSGAVRYAAADRARRAVAVAGTRRRAALVRGDRRVGVARLGDLLRAGPAIDRLQRHHQQRATTRGARRATGPVRRRPPPRRWCGRASRSGRRRLPERLAGYAPGVGHRRRRIPRRAGPEQRGTSCAGSRPARCHIAGHDTTVRMSVTAAGSACGWIGGDSRQVRGFYGCSGTR